MLFPKSLSSSFSKIKIHHWIPYILESRGPIGFNSFPWRGHLFEDYYYNWARR